MTAVVTTSLQSISVEIRAEVDAADRDCQSALGHAIRAGELYIEAKSLCKHGEWLPWLEANDLNHRNAQNYMRLANAQVPAYLEEGLTIEAALKALAGRSRVFGSGEYEWYTPAEHIEAARDVMGGIDLDPASCVAANEVVRADTFYTEEDDGLAQDWAGRVWMNPPYSQPLMGQFCEKLVASENVTEWIALANSATATRWFQTLSTAGDAVCFTKDRLKFWHPERGTNSLPWGQVLVYSGPRRAEFVKRFGPLGSVWVTA